MKRVNDCIKEFKNGNISIKYDRETIEESKRDNVLTIASVLDRIDCYFIGETFNLSNFATGHLVYNAYSDLVYIFPWNELETLESGKTLKLYASKPNQDDRELIEREGY